jgi:hypothetical protein
MVDSFNSSGNLETKIEPELHSHSNILFKLQPLEHIVKGREEKLDEDPG